MKILKLTIKKQWYDMILSGIKKEEYREIKPFWKSRLTNQKANLARPQSQWKFNQYDAIQFFNGAYYGEDLPNFIIECKFIAIDHGNPEWGALPEEQYFVIKLGELL